MRHFTDLATSLHVKILAILTCLMLASMAHAQQHFDEVDALIADIVLDGQLIATGVSAYQHESVVMVALSEFFAAIEFPISTDPSTATASGWFIRPDRLFELDIHGGFATNNGDRLDVTHGIDAVVHEGEIYASTQALSRWLPLDLEYYMSAQQLVVSPREPLPMQERAQRRQDRGARRYSMAPPQLPYQENPYRPLGPHTVDIGVSTSAIRQNRHAQATRHFSYSSLLRGDLAWMSSSIYLQGTQDAPLSRVRARLERPFTDAPLGIQHVQLGDVDPINPLGVRSIGPERGIVLRGSTGAYRAGDRVDIQGDELPGWDVELYHNGVLIGRQIVGQDGRYLFPDLPLFQGENHFELLLYGPTGERRTESRYYRAGGGALQRGQFDYSASLTQKGRSLFKTRHMSEPALSNLGSPRFESEISYGLLRGLTVTGGFSSVEIDDQRIEFYTLGTRLSAGGFQAHFDASRDSLGSTTYRSSLSRRIGQVGFRLDHREYGRRLAYDEAAGDRRLSQTGLTVSGNIYTVPTMASITRVRHEHYHDDILALNLTGRYGLVDLSNEFRYTRRHGETTTDSHQNRLDGTLSYGFHASPLSLRGGINFELAPTAVARSLFLNGQLMVSRDMSMVAELSRNIESGYTRYTSGLNWRMDNLTLSPRLSYDSNERYSGFIYASTSVAPRPDGAGVQISGRSMTGSGSVAVRVFVDHNNDGVFNEGDEPLEGVEVRALQHYRAAVTDSQGIAYLTGLRSQRSTDIVLDTGTLPEPNMVSLHEGNSVTPRPGSWNTIDFPIMLTGDIEGTVLLRESDTTLSGLSGMAVELRNAAGATVDVRTSAFDGFFTFTDIPLGLYQVVLAAPNQERLLNAPGRIHLTSERTFVDGLELHVAPRTRQRATTIIAAQEDSAPVALAPIATETLAERRIEAIIPTTPEPAPATAPEPAAVTVPEPAPPPPSATTPINGSHVIQLGSFRSQSAALTGWEILRDRHSALLEGLHPFIEAVQLADRGTFHRLYAVNSLSREAANQRCQQLIDAGQQCLVAEAPRRPAASRSAPQLPQVTPTPARPTEPPRSPPASASAPAQGVQLASFRERERAEQMAASVRRQHATLLDGAEVRIMPSTLANRGTFYRVVIHSAHAPQLCERLQQRGSECVVIALANGVSP